jgi:ribosome-associated protein
MVNLNKQEIENLRLAILANLEDSNAKDITAINLAGKSDLCSHMIIVSATSERHAVSIAEKLIFSLKHHALDIPFHAEGLTEGKWVLVDTADIAIHIFHPEIRAYYDLETLWQDPKSRNKQN